MSTAYTKVEIAYNPYLLKTTLTVNGDPPKRDSKLVSAIKDGHRLQEWIGAFPAQLRKEYNSSTFDVHFIGMAVDWDDVTESFAQAKQKGTVTDYTEHFTETAADDSIKEKLKQIMQEMSDSGIEEFRAEKMVQSFERVYSESFPVNVIATMSSGKSTLINALLGRFLMPAANEATTAMITSILDSESDRFTADVRGKKNDKDKEQLLLEQIPDLTLDIMRRLNSDKQVEFVAAQGNIPFLDSKGIRLELIDTPGPNNARDDHHKQKTYNAIAGSSNNLIVYVLNAQQLQITDDYNLLRYVSEQIKKGGKQARDRFLFVINKMDCFQSHEDVLQAVQNARSYLEGFEIEDPLIFPCSALAALDIRTLLKGIDPNQIMTVPDPKGEILQAFSRCRTLNLNKQLHLEQYSTLPPSAAKDIEQQLAEAEQTGDFFRQALIHSGIPSIEAAIRTYVKKYAITKTVKDLVETFQDVVESAATLANLTDKIASNEAAAEQFRARTDLLREQISNGQIADSYKQQIEEITDTNALKETGSDEIAHIISVCNQHMQSKYPGADTKLESEEEAKAYIEEYTQMARNMIPEFQASMVQLIDGTSRKRCEEILHAYQEALQKIDSATEGSELDFSTFDLVKGILSNLQTTFEQTFNTDYALRQAQANGETIKVIDREQRQVGVRQERRAVGTEQVQIGEEEVYCGTEKVKNPDKKWYQFWKKGKIEQAVYRKVPKYETRTVYQTVEIPVFDWIVTESIERRFPIDELRAKVQKEITDVLIGHLNQILEEAQKGLEQLKQEFIQRFNIINRFIEERISALEEIGRSAKENQATLDANRAMLSWIRGIQDALRGILEMREVTA